MGGLVGLVGGLEQADKQRKIAKMQIEGQERFYEAGMAEREKYSQMVQAEQQLATQQLQAAEQARFNVQASLGAPGTYDLPTPTTSGPIGLSLLAPAGLGGISDPGASGAGLLTSGRTVTKSGMVTGEDVKLGKEARFIGERPWDISGQVLDPEAMAASIKSTSGFRQMSRMVAESEQLLNRQGPLWDSLNASITGGIFETAASTQRQLMEQLSREMAKSGTARRQGLAFASAMRIQEDINRQRAGQLWQSKLQLEQWTRDNAINTQNLSTAWVNNHAGIRDTFTGALTNLQTFWSKVMPSSLIAAQAATQQVAANNVFNAGQTMMQAVNTKYGAIIGGVNGTMQGMMNMGQGMMMPSGGGGGPMG